MLSWRIGYRRRESTRAPALPWLLACLLGAISSSASPADLLIRNGTLVTAEETVSADIRVRGEQILEIGHLERQPGERVIDAESLLVLPGGIDPHVHVVAQPGEGTMVDDYEVVSRAAFAGGVTTIGQMAFPADLMNELPLQTLAREAQAAGQSMADVFLHITLFAFSEGAIAQIPELGELGHPSVKVYLPFMGNQDKALTELLAVAAGSGVTVLVHCEDEAMIGYLSSRLLQRGRSGIAHYPESRPTIAEELATHRATRLAEATGARIYVVHLSSADALTAIGETAAPAEVFVETRPMYLHLTEDVYQRADGQLFIGMPPARTARDQAAMWQGLADGRIHTIGSDHAPWTRKQKTEPSLNVASFSTRAGVSSLQMMLPMLFSEGVGRDRLSLNRFVAVTSTVPARIFGLYPQKGTIAVGSDADLVLWDPAEVRTVEDADIVSNAGYSVYAGRQVTGWPQLTIRRGEVVFENGRTLAAAGSGKVLTRAPASKREASLDSL